MPCLIGCLAFFFPRLALIAVWLFSGLLQQAYDTVLWPLLGFLFLPLTTLAYAWAVHANNGSVRGIYLVLVILAVLIDLGLIGGGARTGRRMATSGM